MPQPLAIQFGNWVPDASSQPAPVTGAGMTLPLADCQNVYYANGNYASLPTAVATGSPLPGQCLGAFTAIDQAGSPQIYAGTQTHLYHYNGNSWDVVDGGLTFFAASWTFAQFGSNVIATFAPPQVSTLASFWYGTVGTRNLTIPIGGAAFTYPPGAPSGSVIGVINQFSVIGNVWKPGPSTGGFTVLGTGNGITKVFSTTLVNVPLAPFYVYAGAFPSGGIELSTVDNGLGVLSTPGLQGTVNYSTGLLTLTFNVAPVSGALVQAYYLQSFPYRVQWSAIADQTKWPIPLTNDALAFQSGYEDLDGAFGAVQCIAGFPQFGIVFQCFGITRMSYVGGSVVFSFAPYERKRGAISSHSVIQVGEMVYFIADDGFYVTEGTQVQSIGTSSDNTVGVDDWFRTNVNPAALAVISSGYDAATRNIFWAVPTGTATVPNTLMIYNPIAQKWTKAAISAEFVWPDNTGAKHRLGIINQTHTLATLTGTPASGYCETIDMIFLDGNTRTATGVRPIIQCVDTPVVRMGRRKNITDNVTYTADSAPDRFSRICPLFNTGNLQRVRVTSSNAQSIAGAMVYLETGGMV